MPLVSETKIEVKVISTLTPLSPYASLMRKTVATVSAAEAPIASIDSAMRKQKSMTLRECCSGSEISLLKVEITWVGVDVDLIAPSAVLKMRPVILLPKLCKFLMKLLCTQASLRAEDQRKRTSPSASKTHIKRPDASWVYWCLYCGFIVVCMVA